MEPEDEDNSNPSAEPTLDTDKPFIETQQETEVGEGGDVAQSEQLVDSKEAVEEGSERVEEVEEVNETENRNADMSEEELRVTAEVESTGTRGVVGEVAGELENKGTEGDAEVTGELENKGTEGDAEVAEELGDVTNEELVKEESGDDGELEKMEEKEEGDDGVGEGVGNGGEELSFGQKEEATDVVEESDVNVVEDNEEEKVANREGLEHPEEADAAEKAKLNVNTDMAQGSGDAEIEDAEMDNREDETDNVEEMESAEAGEEKEEAEEGEKMKEVEETEMAEEAEEDESSRSVGGKRKRGKNSKSAVKLPSKKKAEEDVCFICFDGGNLVLCDRRGCPKAYHPSCVNRDEAFFQTKGRWNCGLIQMKAELAGVEFVKG